MTRVLLLGGTTEAGLLARALAEAKVKAIYSYAGRTEAPVAQPLPQRVGGFGGVTGLVEYLRTEGITHVVDATHPFAAQMSWNAVEATEITGIPLLALQRPAWKAGPGDRWISVQSGAEAARALPEAPSRVFLAIGRQGLADYALSPEHDYLLRLVDPPGADLPLSRARIVIARGPFRYEDDLTLLRDHDIQIVVAKNAGGEGARAKLDAARELGLSVIMIERPPLPARLAVESIGAVMAWLHLPLASATERGE
jgi:precorrin-6A/cobalt-precorrin-6A reductase